jgi:LPS sulfotransferase NodH
MRKAPDAIRYRIVRPLAAHRRLGAVVMLHTARCGSTVLARLLGQHPSIHDDGEIYLPVLDGFADRHTSSEIDRVDAVAYTRARLSRSGRRWYLYDAQFDHIDYLHGDLISYLDEIAAIGVSKIVVLRRANVMRKVTSTLMAQRRGCWHVPAGASSPAIDVAVPEGSFVIDGMSGTLLEHLDRVTKWYDMAGSFVADVGADSLFLDYEADLMQDPQVGYQRVVEFLGLPPHRVEVTTQRLNTRPLSEVLTNHAEVTRWLDDTTHSWMLAE